MDGIYWDFNAPDGIPGVIGSGAASPTALLRPASSANRLRASRGRGLGPRPQGGDAEHLRQDIVGFKPGDAVALEVERRGVLQYVAFEME